MLVRIGILGILLIVFSILFYFLIQIFVDLSKRGIKEKKETIDLKNIILLNDDDVKLVELLIENNMLHYYIVSLISSDNEDSKEQWMDSKKKLEKLKGVILSMNLIDKKTYMKEIARAINITNNELKKFEK